MALRRQRLDSWKAIAAYLQRTVRTVQRWERNLQMPVHRQMHADAGTVFSFAEELDSWIQSRTVAPPVEASKGPQFHRVAVLPFRTESRVKDAQMADAFAEQLISRLSVVQNIRVLSQT